MRMRLWATLAIQGVCLLAFAVPSLAQGVLANPARGRDVAAHLCTSCHVIDRDAATPMRADIPSFPAIAKRSGATAEYLAGRIIVPHPVMPGVALTAAEIRDVVAYILTLK